MRRRQFNHNSEDGSGTLQYQHTTIVEDSAANTTFDGGQLDSNLYSLDEYNDGRDGHQISNGGVQKLDRNNRFLTQRAEACAAAVGLQERTIQEVTQLVTSYNSGAFSSYAPEREGGGQDAHIIAAIVYVGNRHLPKNPILVDISNRMENRDELQSLARELGMEQDDVRGAVSQLHRQLR